MTRTKAVRTAAWALILIGLALSIVGQALAAQQVGNGCWVHAWEPVALNASATFEGYPHGHGRIDGCTNQDANYNQLLQSCIQVWTGSGWATKSETCINSGWLYGASIDEHPTAYSFASPRKYRTWSYGCSGGICKVMTSAGVDW